MELTDDGRHFLAHAHAVEAAVSLAEIAQEPLMMLTADEAGEAAQRYWEH